MQLDTYSTYNQFLADLHDMKKAKEQEAFKQDMKARVSKAEEQLDTASGERLSIEDVEDIYMDAMADKRARQNMSRAAGGKDGEINDYLETRRPFGAAQ